jgi:hypothetical protein
VGILGEIDNTYRCDNEQLAQTVKLIIDNPTKYSVDAKLPHYKTRALFNLVGLGLSCYATFISGILSFTSVVAITYGDIATRDLGIDMFLTFTPVIIMFAYLSCKTFVQVKANYIANKKTRETIQSNLKEIQQIIEPWLQSTNKQSLAE